MHFVPYRKLSIRSAMSPEAAAEALRTLVGPARSRRGEEQRPFAGTVDGRAFNIRRVIRYRNSFLPQIRGTIDPDELGVVISITMTLSPVVLVFGVLWLGVAALLGVGFLAFDARSHTLDPITLAPLGMLAFGWVLATVSFGFEAKRATELLVGLFDAPGPGQPFR